MHTRQSIILLMLAVLSASFLVACNPFDTPSAPGAADESSKTPVLEGPSCNGDKGLDEAIQIQSMEMAGGTGLQISSGGGYDQNNGVVRPNWYEVKDERGNITYVPGGIYTGDPDNLLNVHVDGLRGGGTYRIRLMSQDLCGNTGYSQVQTISIPRPQRESNRPLAWGLERKIKPSYIGTYHAVVVHADDDTGVYEIQFVFDDELVSTIRVGTQVTYRIGTAKPTYQWVVPTPEYGRTGMMVVRVIDLFGNVTRINKRLTL